jgi:hypothetical protein
VLTASGIMGGMTPGTLEICDGGRPLRPERWNALRHGTWSYRITAIGPDGLPIPGAKVTIGPAAPGSLCIDGRAYSRRQAARKKRRR